MSGSNAYMVASLLEKMGNEDRDFRYMALNDLINELQRKRLANLDDTIEGKVVRAVLGLIEGKNGEVQNLAIKCLGPLVKQIRLEHILEIVDRLSKLAAQEDDEVLRGIASMGLKTVITEVDPLMGPKICARVIPNLLTMAESSSYEMQMDALDTLAEVLGRFGSQISLEQQEQMQKTLLTLLAHPRPAVRKRATIAIGNFVVHISDAMFSQLLEHLLGEIQKTKGNSEKLRTLVQCAGVLSRYNPKRLGAHLPTLMPIVIKFIEEAGEDDELREICLQALESFVLRCPGETNAYIAQLQQVGLEYMKYDPNFADAGDEDEEEYDVMEEEEEEEEDEFDDVVDYSDDDDDMSWKVRRSAAKLLAAIIETRSDMLQQVYEKVAPVLIARFKEREESVRIDILQTFIALLRQTAVYCGDESALMMDFDKSNVHFDATGFGDELALLPETVKSSSSSSDDMETREGPKQLLQAQVPKLSRAVAKQLSSKSTQTRQISFRLLRELVTVLHGGLGSEIELFVPSIEASLSSTTTEQQHTALTSNLKIEILVFLRQLFRNHPAKTLHPYLNRLSPVIIKTISDKFYKITSEALLLAIELIKVIRPIRRKEDTGEYEIENINEDHKQYIFYIYQATLKLLGTNDADQEVKERSILCFGALMSQTGDILKAEQRAAWDIFLERLRNEVTRLISVRTLAIVCQSPVAAGDELRLCVLTAVDEISVLLRKSNRPLRIASAECLRILIQRYGQDIPQENYMKLLAELRMLVSDTDLTLLPLALRTIEAIITVSPGTIKDVKELVVPSLLELMQSPVLHGAALDSLLSLFAALAKSSPKDYQILVKGLVDPLLGAQTSGVSAGGVAAVANKSAAATVAQCVAVLAVNTDETRRQGTIQEFFGYIQDQQSSDSVKYLSLLTLGEIGRRIDISNLSGVHDQVLTLFASQSEEVKFAAAFALGNMSVGNIPLYLPMIIGQIKEQPKRRYLLLHALKEVITRADEAAKLDDASNEIWTLLIESSDSEQEEGTRSVVAECLGRLALTNPEKFLPELQDRLNSPSGHVRATIATAVKYAVVEPTRDYDELLKSMMTPFLSLLRDNDLNVQRLALLTINSAVHRKPHLIKGVFTVFIPLLYQNTVVKDELIHTVEMGPFKHKVDDGLEIRKAAYECMYTLLSTCLDKIDIQGFLDRVVAGLEDQHDIRMLAYLMLSRLCKVAPAAVTQRLDDLVAPFKTTLEFKMRSNAVKQEVEKNQELVKANLRCIVALASLSDPNVTPRFDSFLKDIRTGPLAEEYKLTVMEADNRESLRNDHMDLS